MAVNKVLVQFSRENSRVTLCFKDYFLIQYIVTILKNEFNAKGTFKNYLLFYLPLFDDYLKEYEIEGEFYVFEPDGFLYSDGFVFWTNLKNEIKFLEILGALKEKVNLVIEEKMF